MEIQCHVHFSFKGGCLAVQVQHEPGPAFGAPKFKDAVLVSMGPHRTCNLLFLGTQISKRSSAHQ